jgi:hypothetical protein
MKSLRVYLREECFVELPAQDIRVEGDFIVFHNNYKDVAKFRHSEVLGYILPSPPEEKPKEEIPF